MPEFNTYNRSLEVPWILRQIERLMTSAKNFSDSSLVLYAALETRNLFERLEFELIAMAAKGTDSEEFLNEICGRLGIQKANKRYNSLKYRYQSFSSAATKAIFEGGTLKTFDLKKSDEFCSELSQYVHSYCRRPEEIIFDSEYIQNGLKLINNCIDYLMSDYFVVIDGGITYGLFDFTTLNPSVKSEFNDWLKRVDQDEEALLNRLIEINNRENGGVKTKISFD
ncbi:hypothetical protein J0A67_00770 [Algoriphagus aestuariicola]|uniref:AbiV family abortive infection protein n=1 Tax=Algoriphagus aestuariicola TaxID=1852016 RepID=A0ABS3BJA0_9BACT|nr:hypothetical protein [Algoriphagus aestuariicola]MBN7799368.1 hypothetical protein [Algoriphagus aestuariicola]